MSIRKFQFFQRQFFRGLRPFFLTSILFHICAALYFSHQNPETLLKDDVIEITFEEKSSFSTQVEISKSAQAKKMIISKKAQKFSTADESSKMVAPDRRFSLSIEQTQNLIAESLHAGIHKGSVATMEQRMLEEKARAEKGDYGQAGLGSGAFVEGISFQEGLTSTYFWQALISKLNDELVYPEDLVKGRIQGNFQFDFYVSQRGELLGDFVNISSGDPYLKVYLQAFLIQVLDKPLAKRYWYPEEKKIPVTVQFVFEINTATYPSVPKEMRSQNNEFTLVRRTYLNPYWAEQLDRFFTKYVPPIIPVPGGVYIDIIRMVEYLQNLHPDAIDAEERRLQRSQLTREELERFIKKYKQKPKAPESSRSHCEPDRNCLERS